MGLPQRCREGNQGLAGEEARRWRVSHATPRAHRGRHLGPSYWAGA